MPEIEVRTTGSEEAWDGVTELWRGGEQIAYTHYGMTDGELMLLIEPRSDGSPLVVEVRCLTDALAEVARVLAVF